MHMSHGAIDRCAEGRAAERGAQSAGARDRHGGRCGLVVSPVRAFATSGIPLPPRGAGDRPYGATCRTVGTNHAEDTSEYRARCASLFVDIFSVIDTDGATSGTVWPIACASWR